MIAGYLSIILNILAAAYLPDPIFLKDGASCPKLKLPNNIL